MELERDKVRSSLLIKLDEFISEWQKVDRNEQKDWVNELCYAKFEAEEDIPVRMPLFEDVLFPVLLDFYRQRKQYAAYWLAEMDQLIYKRQKFQEQLGEGRWTKVALLEEAINVDPQNKKAKDKLVKALLWEIDFTLHELPMGVIGFTSTNIQADYTNLMSVLLQLKALISTGKQEKDFSELIDYAAQHYQEYANYLNNVDNYQSYEDYCVKNKVEIK
uniref:Uncharacterized protein n=1 Tax=Roseihalotalea indica TaxID=2867963 RepID=A0AA49GP06_9BACT|nr:hypothetical protein K4G66_31545 [Tunicatimonas sp. TK19036]